MLFCHKQYFVFRLWGFCRWGFCPESDFVHGAFVNGAFVNGTIVCWGFCPGFGKIHQYSQTKLSCIILNMSQLIKLKIRFTEIYCILCLKNKCTGAQVKLK